MPCCVSSDEGIGDGYELTGAGNGGEGVVLTGFAEASVGCFQQRVPMLSCGKGSEEDRAAEAAPTTGDVSASFVLAAIGIEGGNTDQRSSFGAAEAAEFGHADHQSHGGDVADAWDAEQDIEAAGKVGLGPKPAQQAYELLGAALGKALDLSLEEA